MPINTELFILSQDSFQTDRDNFIMICLHEWDSWRHRVWKCLWWKSQTLSWITQRQMSLQLHFRYLPVLHLYVIPLSWFCLLF